VPNEEHFRKLERMYLSALTNAYYEPAIRIEEGRAQVRIPIAPKLFHAAGATHGAVYCKAIDDACFFAANSLVEDAFVLTTQLNVYLTRAVTGGEIVAHGKVVFQSKRFLLAEAVVTDSEDREVARGSGTFVPGKQRLTPEIGYALE